MEDGITINIEDEPEKKTRPMKKIAPKKDGFAAARAAKERKNKEFEEMKAQLAELKAALEKSKPKAESSHTADEFVEALNKKLAGGPSLDDLENLPLEKYTDYLKYNTMLRDMRKRTRKKIRPFKYPPLDIIPKQKVKLTRSKNKSQPISINIRDSVNFVHFKGQFKHGDEVEIPHCIIEKINNLATPVYKQVKYADGSSETVLDYWDNVYSCQTVV